MNKIIVVALFGQSAAGKDTIQNWIVSNIPNTNKIISCTTRPKRDYEENEKDYFFITEEEFGEKVLDGTMLEATVFNNWFYGTTIESLQKNKINIGVFNPMGVRYLLEDSRLKVIPIWIISQDKDRLLRSLLREENPDCEEIIRRFIEDKKEFSDIDFSYSSIINNQDNINKTLTNISYILENIDQND